MYNKGLKKTLWWNMKKYGLISLFIIASHAAFAVNAAPQIKTHFKNLTAISCDSTAQRCVALGFLREKNTLTDVVFATNDGGNTWSKPTTLHHPHATSLKIHCNDTGLVCLIAGSTHIGTTPYLISYTTQDAGLSWSEPAMHPLAKEQRYYDAQHLACSQSGDQCLLLLKGMSTFVTYTTQDAGQSWSNPIALPKPRNSAESNTIHDVSCSDSGLVCTVVGGSATYSPNGYIVEPVTYVTKNGGLTWIGPNKLQPQNNKTPNFAESDYFSHVRCNRTGLKCIALRYQEMDEGHIVRSYIDAYTTLDGSISWQKEGSVANNANGEIYEPFSAFDCDKETQTCFAVSSPVGSEGSHITGFATHNGGQNWTPLTLDVPTTPSYLSDVFCDDSGVLCQAVGMDDPFQ